MGDLGSVFFYMVKSERNICIQTREAETNP